MFKTSFGMPSHILHREDNFTNMCQVPNKMFPNALMTNVFY